MALLILHRSGMANATPAIPFPLPMCTVVKNLLQVILWINFRRNFPIIRHLRYHKYDNRRFVHLNNIIVYLQLLNSVFCPHTVPFSPTTL